MIDHVQLTEQYLLGCYQAPLVMKEETPFYAYYEDSDRFCYRLHKPTNVLFLQNKQTGEWERYTQLE